MSDVAKDAENGAWLILDRNSTDDDRLLVVAAYTEHGLACVDCGDVMHPVCRQNPARRVWHFAHNGGGDGCPRSAGESDDHQETKKIIIRAARLAGFDAVSEVQSADHRRSDVVIPPPGCPRQFWEIQLSPESFPAHDARHRELAESGQPVWVALIEHDWPDAHPWLIVALDGSVRAGVELDDGRPVGMTLPNFITALANGEATEGERCWVIPPSVPHSLRYVPAPSTIYWPAEAAIPYMPALQGKSQAVQRSTAAWLGPRYTKRSAPLEPPYPDRFVGEDLQQRIDAFRGGSRTGLVPCSVCGQRMFPSSLGGHARCLGVESVQEPLGGPRLIGDFLASAVADLGRQAAADDAEKARAAEAAKAAMPEAPAAPEQELPAVAFEPDPDARRRITKALSGAMRCRLCRKPIHSVADWSGRDPGGDPMPTHFICAEAEAQGVDVDDVYALSPHGGKVKGRKGRDLANVIWATVVDETERHWTDWAAAMATPDEGAAEPE